MTNLDPSKCKQLIEYFSRGAEEDLRNGLEIITKTSRYVSGLFFLHLCLEKSLKALYVKRHGQHAPYTHNLLGLIEKIGLNLLEDDLNILSEINEFNLEARYPDDKFSLYQKTTKDIANHYLNECVRLHSWILETLNN